MEFNFIKQNSEVISAEKYLELTPLEKSNIESSHIIAPSLGDDSFGKIQINYRVPVFKKASNE
jgi:hypothetical protein